MEISSPRLGSQNHDEASVATSYLRDPSSSLPFHSTDKENRASVPFRDQYTIGWIAALPLELAAARAMLDQQYEKPSDFTQTSFDKNSYTWGCIGEHNVVIASLPAGVYGTISAATTASQMLSSFPHIRFGLMVGIGAAIPRPEEGLDIRLGDVVVSQPDGKSGGVVQYDLGKEKTEGFERKGILNMPPEALLRVLAALQATHMMESSKIPRYLQEMIQKYPLMAKAKPRYPGYVYQGKQKDRLFRSSYIHSSKVGCDKCDQTEIIQRDDRASDEPEIYYGVIASGDKLVKDAVIRDLILEDAGEECICLEMEAAGLMNTFPCLVIRGMCDYADSHKNDCWQPYAAATAAAYGKEFLGVLQGEEVERSEKATEIVNRLQKIETKMDNISHSFHNLHSAFTWNELNKWLLPPDPSSNLNEALKKRHEGTGSWFLNGIMFQEWRSGLCQYLWLHGMPGAGKTVLSSSVIKKIRDSDENSIPLYFFFDFSDEKKRTLHGLLRSLIAQLCLYFPQSQKCVESQFTTKGHNGVQQPYTEDLVVTFWSMLSMVDGRVQIILDALDECRTRDDLLLWIKELSDLGQENVSLLVTSRKERDIEKSLACWFGERNSIPIHVDETDKDIQAYVQATLNTHQNFQRWKSRHDVLQEMETQIMQKAKGMFRLAACQLDLLMKCIDYGDVQKILVSLPRTLFDVYARVLEQISDLHRQKVIRILQFLVYSERPLSIQEAVDIIAVEPDKQISFEPRLRMPDPWDIMNLCPGLLSIIKPTDDENVEKQILAEVHLAHMSVKDYLTSQEIHGNFREISDEVASRTSIVKICLTYLLHLDKKDDLETSIRHNFPLAYFCSRYWMEHAKLSKVQLSAKDIILRFLKDSMIYRKSCLLFTPGEDEISKYVTPLHYVSIGGLVEAVEGLLREGADIDAQSQPYNTALQAASGMGNKEVVQLLLHRGADINAQGGVYGNALQAAFFKGDEELVLLLLNNGADINAQSGINGTALQAAFNMGNKEIIQLLFDKGADINAQGEFYGTALHAASSMGNKEIIQLLLDKGADINIQGGVYGNALQAASKMGYKEVVQLLLDNGADINAQGGEYGSALQAASKLGNKEVVQLLLDRGADINIQGGVYGTTLQVASKMHYYIVLQHLLDGGVDINIQGEVFGNALQAGLWRGNKELIELLLDRGADINAQGGHFGNALQVCLWRGNKELIELLLDKGADINAQGGYHGNVLQAASYKGNKEVVQLLLDRGADINAQGGEHGSALQAASIMGHMEIVDLLLHRGADINAQGGGIYNALQAASIMGHMEIVDLLLHRGLDGLKAKDAD